MTPVLFLRPEGRAQALADAVERHMRRAGFGPGLLRCAECPLGPSHVRATALMLSARYTDLIDLEATDTTLHVVLLLPLWEPGAAEAATSLVEAAEAIPHRTSVDILGLQSALAFDATDEARAAMHDAERDTIAAIAARATGATVPCRLDLLDNFSSSGAAAGFDDALLAAFVAELLRVFIENYADTFGRLGNLSAVGRPAVVATGMAGLEFDREAMADYLLSRAFVSALDKAGIATEKVDAQSAARRAAACLEGIDRFYEEFYDRQVEPLVAAGLPEGEIAARLRAPLDHACAALRARLTSFLDDATLSLPQKEAVWAILLGLDNSLLDGARYREHHLSFDDVMSQPIDLYVKAFNDHCAGSTLLPTLGMYPAIPRDILDPGPDQAMNPLPRIKAAKADMLDLTAFMRAKERELEALDAAEGARTLAEGHLSDDGFVWRGVSRRLDTAAIVEQPLQHIYEPPKGLKPLPSVDLRRYFSPVRDQGALGSCTSFAATALYEYILNRATGGATPASLSEQFLFYHTNVATGHPDSGSTFADQLAAMGRHGICAEELYPYRAADTCPPPGPEATADAARHRVLRAMQIPLATATGAARYDAMQANHAMLTAALTEGYPVGIALRLFDDFADHPGGHVPRPADDAIAHSGHGRHAMVIAGYSERDKCYIVRNSWGTAFGDNGYAYISASYIDDPDLCLFACIVAETTDGTPHAADTPVPALLAPFSGTQTQINIAATRNALDDARLRLASLNDTYHELYRYYADLVQHLAQPLVRNDIRRQAEIALTLEIHNLETRRAELIDAMPGKLRDFSHSYIKACLNLSSITIVAWLIAWVLWKYPLGRAHLWATGAAALATVITAAAWLHYKWARRRRRRELRQEIDHLATTLGRKQRSLLTLQLRFHVAGMLVDDMHALSLRLHARYQHLLSFNNNLRCWYDEYSRRAATAPGAGRGMFVRLIHPQLLDAFYSSHDTAVAARIDLMDAFRHFDLSPGGMQRVRNSLEDATRAAIATLFHDFTMARYITGARSYPYLPQASIEATLKRLNRLAGVLTRHNAVDTTFQSKHLIACVDPHMRSRWLAMCSPHFAYQPMTLDSAHIDRIAILTLDCIPATDLI